MELQVEKDSNRLRSDWEMRKRRKYFCISRVVEGKTTAGSGVDGPGIVPTRPEQLRREWRESGKEGPLSRSPLGTWPWGGGNQKSERASALYSGGLYVCPTALWLGPAWLRPYYLRSCVQAVSTRAVRARVSTWSLLHCFW